MNRFMRVALALVIPLMAAQAASAQDKGLTVDGNGNVEISGSLTVRGDLIVNGDVKTDGYFYKWFGTELWRLDYGDLRRYVAMWYAGAPSSLVSVSEPEKIAKGLELVRGMKGMSYSVKQPGGERRDYGLMPDGGQGLPSTILIKDQLGHTWVDDRHAVAFLVEAVKEQQKLIETLQGELKSITSRLNQTTTNPR